MRDRIGCGTILAARLHRGYPWDVGRLIRQGGSDIASFASWRDHLAPILAEGSESEPDIVLPEVANLIATQASTERVAGADPPVFRNPFGIDRERAVALFGEVLDTVLARLASYGGSDVYVLRAKEESARWLAERGSNEAAAD